jgi:hypothetical protein
VTKYARDLHEGIDYYREGEEHAEGWVDGCVGGWMGEQVCVCVDGWVGGWMSLFVCVCVWMGGCVCVFYSRIRCTKMAISWYLHNQ